MRTNLSIERLAPSKTSSGGQQAWAKIQQSRECLQMLFVEFLSGLIKHLFALGSEYMVAFFDIHFTTKLGLLKLRQTP